MFKKIREKKYFFHLMLLLVIVSLAQIKVSDIFCNPLPYYPIFIPFNDIESDWDIVEQAESSNISSVNDSVYDDINGVLKGGLFLYYDLLKNNNTNTIAYTPMTRFYIKFNETDCDYFAMMLNYSSLKVFYYHSFSLSFSVSNSSDEIWIEMHGTSFRDYFNIEQVLYPHTEDLLGVGILNGAFNTGDRIRECNQHTEISTIEIYSSGGYTPLIGVDIFPILASIFIILSTFGKVKSKRSYEKL